MFRTGFLSIVRSLALYTQQYIQVMLTAVSITCLKHVEFYSKNKFEKLVHVVGFIIRIYHDARSSECQRSKIGQVSRSYYILERKWAQPDSG